MSTLPTRALGALAALTALTATLLIPSPARADDDVDDPTTVLAQLTYRDGLTVRFVAGDGGQEFGLIQTGASGRTGPLIADPDHGLLVAYLTITPPTVAVPQGLLAAQPPGAPTPPQLAGRTIVPGPVTVGDLTSPVRPQASVGCNDTYYNSYHWLEGDPFPPAPLPTHTYYASSFGGMHEFSDSFIVNCNGEAARHRIYYKSGGSYHKQFDDFVWLGHWQAAHFGSVLRYRKVAYEAGSGYIRQGRFHN